MQTILGAARAFGIQRLWKGFRTNDQTLLAIGAGAVLIAWYGKPKKRTLLHSQKLAAGESITIATKPRKAS